MGTIGQKASYLLSDLDNSLLAEPQWLRVCGENPISLYWLAAQLDASCIMPQAPSRVYFTCLVLP